MSAEEAVRFARALGRPASWLLGSETSRTTTSRTTDLASLIRADRDRIRRICARHGASRVRVFGSVARGEARPDSDVDLLVDMAPGRTLFDLAAIHAELAELLGRPVDVGTRDMLRDRIRDRVLREAVPI